MLTGTTLYIPFSSGYILEYDLCGGGLVVTRVPVEFLIAFEDNVMLMPVKGSGLGVACIDDDDLTLSMWSREARGHSDDVMVWKGCRVIDLSSLLPTKDYTELLGFAEGVNVIFLGTNDDIFTLMLDPELVCRVGGRGNSELLLPFISFYTPVCELVQIGLTYFGARSIDQVANARDVKMTKKISMYFVTRDV
ncbi:unnamed protein product [Urochloa humidicola]